MNKKIKKPKGCKAVPFDLSVVDHNPPRYDLINNAWTRRTEPMPIKSIRISVIPHRSQRYETVGDWMIDKQGNIKILVSDMGNWKYNMLVGLHEMIEVLLCHERGISDCIVTNFDKQFEAKRKKNNTDEPGDEPDAPYQNEHNFATGIERTMAAMLGVKWKEYDKAVNDL